MKMETKNWITTEMMELREFGGLRLHTSDCFFHRSMFLRWALVKWSQTFLWLAAPNTLSIWETRPIMAYVFWFYISFGIFWFCFGLFDCFDNFIKCIKYFRKNYNLISLEFKREREKIRENNMNKNKYQQT